MGKMYDRIKNKTIKAEFQPKATAVSFVAIRHQKDGAPEFVHATVDIFGKIKNNKDHLLQHICLTKWGHNPPVAAIAEHLMQTQTYAMFRKMHDNPGWIINYYEYDEEFSQSGKPAHSCREIWAVRDTDALADYAQTLKEDLTGSGYSIKETN